MATSCECPHGREIERFRKALDGNGHPGLWTEIAIIKTKLNIIIAVVGTIGAAVAATLVTILLDRQYHQCTTIKSHSAAVPAALSARSAD